MWPGSCDQTGTEGHNLINTIQIGASGPGGQPAATKSARKALPPESNAVPELARAQRGRAPPCETAHYCKSPVAPRDSLSGRRVLLRLASGFWSLTRLGQAPKSSGVVGAPVPATRAVGAEAGGVTPDTVKAVKATAACELLARTGAPQGSFKRRSHWGRREIGGQGPSPTQSSQGNAPPRKRRCPTSFSRAGRAGHPLRSRRKAGGPVLSP